MDNKVKENGICTTMLKSINIELETNFCILKDILDQLNNINPEEKPEKKSPVETPAVSFDFSSQLNEANRKVQTEQSLLAAIRNKLDELF